MKCGFVITGLPKIVWALKLPTTTIEEDEQNENWYQLGTNMMITKYTINNNCCNTLQK